MNAKDLQAYKPMLIQTYKAQGVKNAERRAAITLQIAEQLRRKMAPAQVNKNVV